MLSGKCEPHILEGSGAVCLSPCEVAFSASTRVCAHHVPICFQILMIDSVFFGHSRGSLDQSLKDTLKKFSSEKRFAYWSGYVKSLAVHAADTEGSSCTSLVEYQMLVSAWRVLLIIATSHVRTSWGKFPLWFPSSDVPGYLAVTAFWDEE